ncbi:MAG: DUF1343 domain-containing protein [Candidatus Latescibacterota bacterium]|jgi:uncharacterized protein YbbC (DUF1343 family)
MIPRVALGTDRLLTDRLDLIRGRRVGLITNHSGVDHRLRATADRLHESADCRLVALFGPEHGIRGDAADGDLVSGSRDARTGLPVHSLYGRTQRPEEEMLAGIEVMVYDLQDVGARFYTYLYTMSLSMEACAGQGIPFVVLDRPNPIGGRTVAGCVLEPGFASFVGLYPIPIQYGMTVGELAGLFNELFGLGVELHVVELEGWTRSMHWEETGLPWVPPSPNMPTVDTAVIYPGTCLIEGTNLSEGRGTAKPFEQLGAPWVDADLLADRLNNLDLPGVRFRPVSFRPTTSKHAGKVCHGVQLHVLDRGPFQAVRTGLEVLAALRALWPAEFAWRVPAEGIYNFDRLAGTDRLRLALDEGKPVNEILAGWTPSLDAFAERRRSFLRYA